MEGYIKVYIVFLILIISCFSCSIYSLINSKCYGPCPNNYHREQYFPYSGKYCNCVYDREECSKSTFPNSKIVEKIYNNETGKWGDCKVTLCEDGYKLQNNTDRINATDIVNLIFN